MEKEILKAIYFAIDRTNELTPEGQRLEKSVNAFLFDKEGVLDSLGLINFIVATEESIEDSFGMILNLSSAIDDLKNENHLRTVGTLAAYIEKQLRAWRKNEA